MSGRKESDFQLEREREAKLDLLQRMASLRSEVQHMKACLAEALASAPEGLRSTFQAEVTQAEQWLRTAAVPNRQPLDTDSDLPLLQDLCSRLERTAAEGRRAHQQLIVAFTQKADTLGRQLAQQVAAAEQLLMSRHHDLGLWFGQAETERWQRDLDGARNQLQRQDYAAGGRAVTALQRELEDKSRHAEDQEAKHQRRLYLVAALRKACATMGFKELEAPRLRTEADRGSSILYKVDTLDRGQIAFTITLETIHSHAGAASAHCFEEFDELSRHLNDEFGVKTEFRYSDGSPRPQFVHKQQRALPRTKGRSASQSC